MRPILFSLGSLNFYSFGFFAALGYILSGMVIHRLAKKKRLLTSKHREYFLLDALLLALVSGIVGARLTYILTYNVLFRIDPLAEVTNLLGGGFVFYGGAAIALGVFYWWFKKHDMLNWAWFDVIITGLLVSMAFTGFASYLNDGQLLHVAEMVGYSVLAGVAYQTFRVEKAAGRTFVISLLLIFLFRFFLGFWEIERIEWIGLGFGQWVSLGGMLLVARIIYKDLK